MNDLHMKILGISGKRKHVLPRKITKIPIWRKIRRFITKHLFGYVNVNDFGVFKGDEDSTKGLQAAIDYCSKVHTSHTINLGGSIRSNHDRD